MIWLQEHKNLTEANKGYDVNPKFSPDGKSLIWQSMARDGYEADKNDVKIMDWKTGRQRILQQVGMTAFQEMFFGEQIQKRSTLQPLTEEQNNFSLWIQNQQKYSRLPKEILTLTKSLQTIKPHF
jgi:hypothetical protein